MAKGGGGGSRAAKGGRQVNFRGGARPTGRKVPTLNNNRSVNARGKVFQTGTMKQVYRAQMKAVPKSYKGTRRERAFGTLAGGSGSFKNRINKASQIALYQNNAARARRRAVIGAPIRALRKYQTRPNR